MARITVEDCLRQVDNRFSLVHLAAKRVRQLKEGAVPFLPAKNKEIVVSLREIALGAVHAIDDQRQPYKPLDSHFKFKPDED
jgi:DNA-directed RNA polymerase subunit omega